MWFGPRWQNPTYQLFSVLSCPFMLVCVRMRLCVHVCLISCQRCLILLQHQLKYRIHADYGCVWIISIIYKGENDGERIKKQLAHPDVETAQWLQIGCLRIISEAKLLISLNATEWWNRKSLELASDAPQSPAISWTSVYRPWWCLVPSDWWSSDYRALGQIWNNIQQNKTKLSPTNR